MEFSAFGGELVAEVGVAVRHGSTESMGDITVEALSHSWSGPGSGMSAVAGGSPWRQEQA
ncbi:hypothetical protein GCM10023257_16240 [Streptomyces hyderabadensis]|uniref:Uncharacterized protein n=1 Tax=Streptomyces hyderabadensis TaxID=598549 RepID=A0ABP9HVH1_9ACTN